MNYLVIDGEWTIGLWGKGEGGDPFDPRNRLVAVAVASPAGAMCLPIEYGTAPFGEALRDLQTLIDESEILVLFNAKRDLHWLRRYKIKFNHKPVWDIQLAHFIRTYQEHPYPSLNDVAEFYGLGKKLEFIEEKYWKNKIDNDQIPWSELSEYATHDAVLEEGAFLAQLEDFKELPALRNLVELSCEDLLILEEMEWNGLPYDVSTSLGEADRVRGDLSILNSRLIELVGDNRINFNSPEQLSAVLYGGTLVHFHRVPDGTFKTGKKAGQTKYRNVAEEVTYERLVAPLPNTKLAKDGVYSTNEGTLRQIRDKSKNKKVIEIIEILLEMGKLEKLVSSYYEGIPKLISTYQWEHNTVHGNLNQCVVATGRLSSSRPNCQNTPESVDALFRSRFNY